MPLELLKANSRNSDICNSCLTARPTDAGLPGAKAEVELDVIECCCRVCGIYSEGAANSSAAEDTRKHVTR